MNKNSGPKIYLETKNDKRTELSLDTFLKKNKDFAFGTASKEEAHRTLVSAFNNILKNIPTNTDNLHIVVLETAPQDCGDIDYKRDYMGIDLFQQFFMYYAVLLNEVLCQDLIDDTYIKHYSDPYNIRIFIYGMKKENNSLIVKSFIFGSIEVAKPECLEIQLTCGSGGTALLFDKVKSLIKDKKFSEEANNKLKYIKIDSLENENTINFYSKIGFYKNNKDSNKIVKDLIKSVYAKKVESFPNYVKKSSERTGGILYWSPYSKELEKLKCKYIYEPRLWFIKLHEAKEQGISKKDALANFYKMHQELKGAGFEERAM
jgi:hypothetical protein